MKQPPPIIDIQTSIASRPFVEMNVSKLINYSTNMCANGLDGTTTILYYMEERLSIMPNFLLH